MTLEHPSSNELRDYFQNIDNCYNDLREARKGFGSSVTTEAEYDQMEKTLALMYVHCPEEIQDIVLATIEEAEMRRF